MATSSSGNGNGKRRDLEIQKNTKDAFRDAFLAPTLLARSLRRQRQVFLPRTLQYRAGTRLYQQHKRRFAEPGLLRSLIFSIDGLSSLLDGTAVCIFLLALSEKDGTFRVVTPPQVHLLSGEDSLEKVLPCPPQISPSIPDPYSSASSEDIGCSLCLQLLQKEHPILQMLKDESMLTLPISSEKVTMEDLRARIPVSSKSTLGAPLAISMLDIRIGYYGSKPTKGYEAADSTLTEQTLHERVVITALDSRVPLSWSPNSCSISSPPPSDELISTMHTSDSNGTKEDGMRCMGASMSICVQRFCYMLVLFTHFIEGI
mmetsp:Transcript_569/g.757  ORF Transcript_569/g.757 Transcript_569/m.757 type:complete len:316 (-) Transcript_569:1359-2306(-)